MLDRLEPHPGAQPTRKRFGRGPGSTRGRYCGRGIKGQGTRSKGKGAGFEGGQMPLARRLPKRGFSHQPWAVRVEIVNVGALAVFGEGATVDVGALVARGLVRKAHDKVKVLGEGDAPKGLTLKVHRVSAGARQKIESAGGSVETL